jgi:two-component system, chemotaxis family, sensor kinase CheA
MDAMTDSQDSWLMNGALREHVEELAMRLVLNSPAEGRARAGEYAAAFAGIGKEAQAAGRVDVAELALELAQVARGETCDPNELDRSLQEGIAKLQEALETEVPATPVSTEPTGPEKKTQPARSPALNALAQDPELLSDFVLESREHLDSIETLCLALEQDPGNAEAVHTIFRGFHTIKGLAGFLDLSEAQEVAHEAENVLDRARNSVLQINSEVIDVILAAADFLKAWVDRLDAELKRQTPRATPPPGNILARIHGLLHAGQAQPEAVSSNPAPPAVTHPEAAKPERQPSASAGKGDGGAASHEPATPPAESTQAETATTKTAGATAESRAVKVDTAKLDYLVDMAGEMVIAQSMVRHDPDLAALKSPRIQRNLSQLARITSEIQKTSMSMRLVPIGHLFQRMARLVRDLSRKMGKPAELEMTGEDTEIDRNIVEELADPLMHMVRNALDHGLEDPAGRSKAAKNPVGRIGLRAYHQAGHVIIEISDDGRGLDKDRILARATEKGLVSPSAALSEQEIFNLIFEPGFSTAAQVTDVSGRGVGMDVVRKHIQKLRGRTEIRSTLGQGSVFLLKLPLTLAIIDGLVVGVGEERYILPMFAVREMFRPTPDVLSTVQNRSEMVLVRGSLLPIIRLYQRFRVKPHSEDPCQGLLIVTESETRRFCLLVDELIGKQEVVIKTLGETFKHVQGIAGGAILGDGRVGLILDLDGLFTSRANE